VLLPTAPILAPLSCGTRAASLFVKQTLLANSCFAPDVEAIWMEGTASLAASTPPTLGALVLAECDPQGPRSRQARYSTS
jgi:hypothetical protein